MPQLAHHELGEAKKLEGVAMLRSPPSSGADQRADEARAEAHALARLRPRRLDVGDPILMRLPKHWDKSDLALACGTTDPALRT
jgi:hypothetical protein